MNHLKKTIRQKFESLTKGQQRIATYLVENMEEVAFRTAKEVGEVTGTSETTVIRLSYMLGFSGYSELQKLIQNSVLKKQQSDTLERFRESTRLRDAATSVIHETAKEDMEFIQRTLTSLDEKQLERIIEHILASDQLFIVGSRSSFAPASWLHFSVNLILGNARLYRGSADDAIHHMSQLTEKSLVIAFSFPRYAQETVSYVQAAKDRGASILAITDHELSPVGVKADYLLEVKTAIPTALKGMPVIFSVLNVLVNGIFAHDLENVQQRIDEYDRISRESGLFPFAKMMDAKDED